MIHLILGGARSGKSRFAENEAAANNETVTYVATATINDDEMRARIEHHKNSRPEDWQLVEEPFNLSKVIEEMDGGTLIIECMTLWLSNWLCTNDTEGWKEERERFFVSLKNSQANIVIVSNEVGSGVVPMGELSRDFVDQAGWLNQELAKTAAKVTLVVAGCPISLKPKEDA
ncbi:bifunctional adenosylcobinamide kinase/adenosylcobinamide-phosphate guanylyltransferase [Aliikangiella coralliicola]|uniref:Bifunctional adenosylcobalamin biosynthesis protein n=1 Tax=Aliikangiella coralliicola TaxID=2592383 RepID=A0A545UJI6_9GAMM|nr:bifunctional adenosylcobinamide kinase/adenosylcobinamide-phosphate guanylyltransferase [Aliikangiella coralliicola]TQV89620.1 bifunctional adenosylcobinamide kinase/adenosylcobinamide-phosphate guanylyltransferase [Aliikangiella coralliicola]